MTTKRPMLILNGKPTRYWLLSVTFGHIFHPADLFPKVNIDSKPYYGAQVSQSTRPSGRRVIWVSTEVEDV